jgi:DnaJ-class molecular chaperone
MVKTLEKGLVEVRCAFCQGEGKDPFDLLSQNALCAVCGGSGKVVVHPPIHSCAFCRGSGVFPGSRLTCTSCMGKGAVTVEEPARTCPACGGAGSLAGQALPCSACGGKGLIAAPGGASGSHRRPAASMAVKRGKR